MLSWSFTPVRPQSESGPGPFLGCQSLAPEECPGSCFSNVSRVHRTELCNFDASLLFLARARTTGKRAVPRRFVRRDELARRTSRRVSVVAPRALVRREDAP